MDREDGEVPQGKQEEEDGNSLSSDGHTDTHVLFMFVYPCCDQYIEYYKYDNSNVYICFISACIC